MQLDWQQMFAYDDRAPLEIAEAGVERRDNVTIHDQSYAAPAGKRVSAFWVEPQGPGPFAGVIFVHPSPRDRSTFLDEALSLAGARIASLLVDAPWSQPEAWGVMRGEPERDRQAYIQTAISLRRAVDLVASRPNVDPHRIGYVGHSFGAIFGGILAGVEKRIKAFVLMAGVGSFTEVAVVNMPGLSGPALERYRQTLAPIDPMHYVGHAAPSALFYQFPTQDEFFSRQQFEAYARAGSEPKWEKWYEVGHYMNDQVRAENAGWLRVQLAGQPQAT